MDIHLPPGAAGLPRHRAKIEAACASGMRVSALAGMAIAGSFALDIADEYSDVDLKLVTTDDGYDDVVTAQDELIAACGNAVARFPADHTGLPELTIVLYDDLVHVDLHPIRLSELAEKNAGMPALVLWERDGSVTRELAKPGPQQPPVDLEWIERRVWTWFWYLHSKILRGEIYEALDGLAWLRVQVLFPLVGAARGESVAGARRVERLLVGIEDAFAATSGTADREGAMKALRSAADLYTTLADPLLEARAIERPDEARTVVGAALAAGLDWRAEA
jgi:hypothetical protein